MVTLEELRRKHQEIVSNEKSSQKGSNDFAQFKESKNLVRFLPGKEDALDFFVETQVHKIKTPDGKFQNYQCRRPHNEACPLCDLMYDLWDRHGELKLPKGEKSKYGTMAAQIKPRGRYFSKVVVRALEGTNDDSGNPVDPVKFLAMSKELFDRVMAAVTDEDLQDESDPENTTMLSLDRGNDFEVTITKKGDYNSFVESKPKIKKSKAGTPQQIAGWMENALDLKSLSKLESYEDGKLLAQNIRAQLDNVSTPQNEQTDTPPFDTDDNDDKFSKEMKS